MASFFDLFAKPDTSIRSKTTGNFISLAEPPTNLKVSDDWEVKSGDVLSWSDYRSGRTYLFVKTFILVLIGYHLFSFSVTPEKTLLINPDTSGAGYLTIPLSITSQFSDAVKYYSSVVNAVGSNYITSIELSPRDAFFASHFSKQPLPESICQRNDLAYSYDPNENTLYINSTKNPKIYQYFPLDTTKTSDLVDWASTTEEPRATWRVSYRAEGDDACKKITTSTISGLPAGWRAESGGSSGGSNFIQGEFKFEGPEKTKEEARKVIEQHFQGVSVQISWTF